jgi:isopropylmalate/homocitrate/citramalate synthase
MPIPAAATAVASLSIPSRISSQSKFADAETLLKEIRASKRIAKHAGDLELTAITIRERAVDRAIELKKDGVGPDRILIMVSTSASLMKKNSGLDHAGYWAEAERCIRKAHDAGITVNGTVSSVGNLALTCMNGSRLQNLAHRLRARVAAVSKTRSIEYVLILIGRRPEGYCISVV